MAHFILLHGSFHAAWNWHRLIPALERAGHTTAAIDLPGHGRDATPPHKVTLARCVDRVVAELDAAAEPAILVAHSRNGIVISQAAEARPDRVRGLVYLAAYLVPSGRSMMDYACADQASLLIQNLEERVGPRKMAAMTRRFRHRAVRWLARALLPASRQTHMLARAAFKEALYHDCPDEIAALAGSLLVPEPHWPGFTPLALTAARFGRVRKVYVECLQDRAITLPLQRRMQAETPCDRVISLDTGHSPFFSRPDALAGALEEAAGYMSSQGVPSEPSYTPSSP